MRRERGTSRRVTAKSISIKHAERRSGDCAPKAAELTSGDLAAGQKSAEDIVDLTVGEANEALQCPKAEQQIGQAGNGERRSERERSGK